MLERALSLLLRKRVRRRRAGIDASGRDPAAAQARVLRALLARAARTEWGRRYGYDSIRNYDDFRRRVPLGDYALQSPVWHRAFAGERDLAWPGHVRYFAMSSGTTAGNKYLPVSRDTIQSNRRGALAIAAAYGDLTGDRELARGRFFYLGGSARLRPKGACLEGDASGIMLRETPRAALRFRLPEPEVAAVESWSERLEAIVERCTCDDYRRVKLLSGCPVWIAALFRRLLAASGAACMAELWPGLRAIVTYGMDPAPYRASLEALVGAAAGAPAAGRPPAFIDTYSSSEGGMSAIQWADSGGAMRLLVDGGAFYEFIPMEEADAPEPRRLSIGEVEPGCVYELALSTDAGIWAYRVGDLVRVENVSPPLIRFAGRTKLTLSVSGEHVIEEELIRAAAAGAEASGARIEEFTVAPVGPDETGGVPRHDWLVEFSQPPGDADAFLRAADDALAAGNSDYADHRRGDAALGAPRLVPLAPGTFGAWLARAGRLGGQFKVPRVPPSREVARAILAVSDDLAAKERGA